MNKRKKSSDINRRKNIVGKLNRSLITIGTIAKYDDTDKLLFLSRVIIKRSKYDGIKLSDILWIEFIEKFYFDKQFNQIYFNWVETKYYWCMPSVDHIIPISKGGDFSISNIQFLSLFENRAKHDMDMNEWNIFKIETNTTSSIFV